MLSSHVISAEHVEAIERATVAAVAPDALQTLPGWLLPMDGGTVGRSHSAVPLRQDASISAVDIGPICAAYRAQGLVPSLRIADVPGLHHLRPALQAEGLRPQQATWTMAAQVSDMLAGAAATAVASIQVAARATDAWRQVYLGEGFDPVDGAHRVRALSRAAGSRYAQAADAQGWVVATGVGSFGQGWMGIHGMRTLPAHRRRGHAGGILRALAREALAQGVRHAYLQVDESNPARQLYGRLGFAMAWRYHYWRPAR